MKQAVWMLVLACFFFGSMVKADTSVSDEHIRAIVKELLQEKDDKIKSLETRILELEAQVHKVNIKHVEIVDDKVPIDENSRVAENTEGSKEEGLLTGIGDMIEEVDAKAKDNGLEISGFFDVSASTKNASGNTFALGAVELDLEYSYDEHFAVSSAFVWDGEVAGIGVAVIDFHMFDDSIPARGRIFSGQGFHLQAGRFDLPFSTDYENFAAPDRVTISAPMTTDRIQQGGFSGDGARVYGSWDMLDYALFWTNSAYEDQGTSMGGRLGLSLGKNNYKLHNKSELSTLTVGFSHLADMDSSYNLRRTVYGGDLSFNYNIYSIESEFLWLKTHEQIIESNEFSYHITLVADLNDLLTVPVKSYIRYGRWNPDYNLIVTDEGAFAVENISRLIVGFNYALNDYLQIKFEYSDSLGTETQELDFNKRLGTAQLVVGF